MQETFFVKLTGKLNIPEKLPIGHNIRLSLDGSVTTEVREDNENGTFNIISKFIPITGEIVKDHGPVIKMKDTRSRSSQLRARLYRIWEATQEDSADCELSYERAMKYILTHAEELYEKSRIQK